ncbi:hypothetical protein J6590_091363 [Homalodisca vitripennis]|nr:hypothetical protein J6590_091363 [Homalodisca vitripennis]
MVTVQKIPKIAEETLQHPERPDTPVMTRFEFSEELGCRLIVHHLQKRLATPSLPRDVKEAIKKTFVNDLPREHRERHVQEPQCPVTTLK